MRDAEELKTVDGVEYLASVPDGEIIKDMVTHSGRLFIATDKHIYVLEDEKWLKKID